MSERMTAEELAEIEKRHESEDAWAYMSEHGSFVLAHRDRAALLDHLRASQTPPHAPEICNSQDCGSTGKMDDCPWAKPGSGEYCSHYAQRHSRQTPPQAVTREDARLFLIQIQTMHIDSQVSNLLDFVRGHTLRAGDIPMLAAQYLDKWGWEDAPPRKAKPIVVDDRQPFMPMCVGCEKMQDERA